MSTVQLQQIKVYGELADFLGFTVFDAAIANAAEAVRCLVANFPKLEAHMGPRYYKVIVEEKEIQAKDLYHPTNSTIKIVPVVGGEGGKGLGQILLGAALIGIAIAAPGAGFLAGGGLGFGSTVAGKFSIAALAGNIGIGLVLSGVSQMLTPVPEDPVEDPDNSFAFSSPVNVASAGVAIPCLYGQRLCGSAVISAAIDVAEVPTD